MWQNTFQKFDSSKNEKKIKIKMNKPIYLGMSILVLAQTLCMNFGMITLNQNIKTEKLCYMDADGFVFILKLKIFTKASLMTLKNGLTHQTTAKMIIDCFR